MPLADAYKAAEHFCRRLQLNTELGKNDDEHRVVVVDDFGEVAVQDAVEAWLTTREGGLLSGGPKARETEGPVMARLRQLRATMQ